MWKVETNTFLGEDGQVYERPTFGGFPSKVDGFYVHPLTGLLLYKEPWRFRRLKNMPTPEIPVPDNEPQVYRKIDGLWFRCLVSVETRSFRPYRKEEVVRRVKSASRKEIVWIKATGPVAQWNESGSLLKERVAVRISPGLPIRRPSSMQRAHRS